ncbi:hypothetical protein QTG54_004505 [Skeletonema marinoi]|uniref:Uncharacterized protein n=1 Tax=Skeletonema marinoi TaxID=267567 RepID=A0AAD9DGI0_9STRA|nr:hypothetical protein QTG54_004505 [Skeletonema marinoi]
MSQVYSTEPATTGHVVFETTHGPIDVNLWCKDVNKIEQYVGDALRWDRKKLEVNPRIRFNHRGQVAMALPLEESTNNTDTEETAMLLAGSTMFNALRIGRTDADDQTGIPTDLEDAPPRIKSVKIDYHPFEDMVITAEKKLPFRKTAANGDGGMGKGGANGQQSTIEKRRKKRKQVRNLNILSFGDEERDYDAITSSAKVSTSMKSSHDFLSAKVDADVEKRSKDKEGEGNKMKSKQKSAKASSLRHV